MLGRRVLPFAPLLAHQQASATRAAHLSECLEPGTDLQAAMAAAIDRLAGAGWQAEGSAEYGFVFIRRGDDRRLLAITERDPYDRTSQSFSPFR